MGGLGVVQTVQEHLAEIAAVRVGDKGFSNDLRFEEAAFGDYQGAVLKCLSSRCPTFSSLSSASLSRVFSTSDTSQNLIMFWMLYISFSKSSRERASTIWMSSISSLNLRRFRCDVV